MRKAYIIQGAAVGLMIAAMWLLEIDGDHIYSPQEPDTIYKIARWVGVSFLLLGFALFPAATIYLSSKLPPRKAFLFAIIWIAISGAALFAAFQFSGVHSWTFLLLLPPAIGLLGALPAVFIATARIERGEFESR